MRALAKTIPNGSKNTTVFYYVVVNYHYGSKRGKYGL